MTHEAGFELGDLVTCDPQYSDLLKLLDNTGYQTKRLIYRSDFAVVLELTTLVEGLSTFFLVRLMTTRGEVGWLHEHELRKA